MLAMPLPRRFDVEFLVDQFDRDSARAGHLSYRARAAFLGLDDGLYYRVATGAVSVSARFVSRVMLAPWPDGPPPFERYFRPRTADIEPDIEVAA